MHTGVIMRWAANMAVLTWSQIHCVARGGVFTAERWEKSSTVIAILVLGDIMQSLYLGAGFSCE